MSSRVSLPALLVLLFSLATSTLATEGAHVRLSNRGSCPRNTPESVIEVDKCIPIAGTKFKSGSLQIYDPWPVCSNGEEAKLAFYWPMSSSCEESALNVLATKKESMNTCNLLMMTGSLGFVCDGLSADPPADDKPPAKDEPPAKDGDQTSEGGIISYKTKKCTAFNKPPATFHAPDTCIPVNEGLGLEFTQGATCKNGTKAIIAGFKGKNCDPTSDPLKEPFTKWDDRVVGFCAPTDDIRSMTFWCDGLEGVDMTKPGGWKQGGHSAGGSKWGLVIGLTLGLGGGLLIVAGALLLAYNINSKFRERVQKLLNRGDGYIAL